MVSKFHWNRGIPSLVTSSKFKEPCFIILKSNTMQSLVRDSWKGAKFFNGDKVCLNRQKDCKFHTIFLSSVQCIFQYISYERYEGLLYPHWSKTDNFETDQFSKPLNKQHDVQLCQIYEVKTIIWQDLECHYSLFWLIMLAVLFPIILRV